MSEKRIFEDTIEYKQEELARMDPKYLHNLLILCDLVNQAKNPPTEERVTQNTVDARLHAAIIETLGLGCGYSGVELYVLNEYEEWFESSETLLSQGKRKTLEVEGGKKLLLGNTGLLVIDNKAYIPCIGNTGLTRRDIGIGRPVNETVIVGYIAMDKPEGIEEDNREEERKFLLKYGRRAGPALHERTVLEYLDYKIQGIVHEIRNPLTGLHAWISEQGYDLKDVLDMLKGDILSVDDLVGKLTGVIRKAYGANQTIDKERTRLQHLTEKLGLVAASYEKNYFNLRRAINYCMNLLKDDPLFEGRHIKYENAERNDPTVKVEGDENAIKQIIINGLRNAAEHGDAPNIWISEEIKTDPEHYDGVATYVTLSDNGNGIPEEKQERFFEGTRPIADEGKQVARGQGGPIMKRIIKRHDGEIWMDTSIAEGTDIHFFLPGGYYVD